MTGPETQAVAAPSGPATVEPLNQPQGAVPMTDIAADKEKPAGSATADEAAQAAPRLESPSAIEPDSSPVLKGKEKEKEEETEMAPPPPPIEKGRTADAGKDKAARQDDSLSIEPTGPTAGSASSPTAASPSPAPNPADGPVCNITLLLPTGARHPYRLDEKYLAKRNVEVPDLTEAGKKDPFSISIYKLKELILREWREEWESKPASPSSIRLIHFGKLLDDKEQLRKYQFSAESPNVVHMSVRPPEMMDDEEGGKGKSTREGRTRESGGRCCVIL